MLLSGDIEFGPRLYVLMLTAEALPFMVLNNEKYVFSKRVRVTARDLCTNFLRVKSFTRGIFKRYANSTSAGWPKIVPRRAPERQSRNSATS